MILAEAIILFLFVLVVGVVAGGILWGAKMIENRTDPKKKLEQKREEIIKQEHYITNLTLQQRGAKTDTELAIYDTYKALAKKKLEELEQQEHALKLEIDRREFERRMDVRK